MLDSKSWRFSSDVEAIEFNLGPLYLLVYKGSFSLVHDRELDEYFLSSFSSSDFEFRVDLTPRQASLVKHRFSIQIEDL